MHEMQLTRRTSLSNPVRRRLLNIVGQVIVWHVLYIVCCSCCVVCTFCTGSHSRASSFSCPGTVATSYAICQWIGQTPSIPTMTLSTVCAQAGRGHLGLGVDEDLGEPEGERRGEGERDAVLQDDVHREEHCREGGGEGSPRGGGRRWFAIKSNKKSPHHQDNNVRRGWGGGCFLEKREVPFGLRPFLNARGVTPL